MAERISGLPIGSPYPGLPAQPLDEEIAGVTIHDNRADVLTRPA